MVYLTSNPSDISALNNDNNYIIFCIAPIKNIRGLERMKLNLLFKPELYPNDIFYMEEYINKLNCLESISSLIDYFIETNARIASGTIVKHLVIFVPPEFKHPNFDILYALSIFLNTRWGVKAKPFTFDITFEELKNQVYLIDVDKREDFTMDCLVCKKLRNKEVFNIFRRV